MKKNTLFAGTLVALIVLALFYFLASKSEHHQTSKLNIKDQPTLGNPKAPVQLVIFEEPKCPSCKKFTLQIFPKLKKDYINTGVITYTIIPVSFLPNSMPAAISWLCIFEEERDEPNHNLLISYIDEMYTKQPPENQNWATKEYLENLAKSNNPAIRTDVLEKCLHNEGYRKQIEKNTAFGSKLMKGQLSTPSLFIDGVLVDDLNYANIQKLINDALNQSDQKK